MSNQFVRISGGALLAIGAVAGGVEACGSSSSGSGGPPGNQATCNQVCDKVGTCLGDAGGLAEQAVAQCKMSSCNSSSGGMCTNQDAILSKVNECLAIADCAGFLQCASSVPRCDTTTATSTTTAATGTGVTTGAGGSTGTGAGGGSGASCDACTKADACCVGLGAPADQCQYGSSCSSASGSGRDRIVGACNTFLQAAASSPSAPAACK